MLYFKKNAYVIKIIAPFWIILFETKVIMLVIMHAKFEVHSW